MGSKTNLRRKERKNNYKNRTGRQTYRMTKRGRERLLRELSLAQSVS